jgi:hypothetical protein
MPLLTDAVALSEWRITSYSLLACSIPVSRDVNENGAAPFLRICAYVCVLVYEGAAPEVLFLMDAETHFLPAPRLVSSSMCVNRRLHFSFSLLICPF